MLTDSHAYSGSFADIQAAERAYRRLRESGFADEGISLSVNEDCPACLYEQAHDQDQASERLILWGQVAGACLGFVFGLYTLWWPAKGASTALWLTRTADGTSGWLDGLIKLCVIASWAMTGAILGAMLGALGGEVLPVARGDRRPVHRHYTLMLVPPPGKEQEAVSILQRSRARVEPAPEQPH